MREGGEIMVVAPGFSFKMSLFHSSAPELLGKGRRKRGGRGPDWSTGRIKNNRATTRFSLKILFSQAGGREIQHGSDPSLNWKCGDAKGHSNPRIFNLN